MADISDALDALAALIAQEFYPGLTAAARAGESLDEAEFPDSAAGLPVYIQTGWPTDQALMATLTPTDPAVKKGAWVTVFPQTNLTQVTSPALSRWEELAKPPATVQAVADDNAGTVTISGAGSDTVYQYVTVLVGRQGYSVVVPADATPESIAQDVADAMRAEHPNVSVDGASVYVPTGGVLQARVGRKGTMLKEIERERQDCMVSIWAADPEARGKVGGIVRKALSDEPRVLLADETKANLYYRQTNDWDEYEKAGVYRRDIHYWVEFSTYLKVDGFEVTAPYFGTSAAPAGS